jgi:hypothetical protein
MKTRRQKQSPIARCQWRINPLLRLLLVFLLSFSLVQKAFADITNSAVATGTYTSPDAPFTSITVNSLNSTVNVPVSFGAPRIELFKSSTLNDPNGDGFAQPGETITYNFPVQNSGSVTLTTIIVTDPKVTVVGGPIVSLAPGATDSTSLTATHVLTPADILAGTFNNSASVTASTASSGSVSDPKSDSLNPADVTPADDDITKTPLKAQIVAVDDTANNINGLAGNPSVLNIFTNDTLGGAAVAPSAVNLTVSLLNPVPPELTFNSFTGLVSVAPGTPAGTYDFGYTICQKASPANCDDALVMVTVVLSTIIADDNDFSATPINGVTGGTTATVYSNDTLNGSPFAPSAVTLTFVPPPGIPTLQIDANTGVVAIPPLTTVGAYNFTYQICEKPGVSNCDSATVKLLVTAPNIVIDAVNDDYSSTSINATLGGTTPIVYVNDTLNGLPFAQAGMTTTLLSDGGITNLTFNPNGTLNVPPVQTPGIHVATYKICQTVDPSKCDQATVTIVINNDAIVKGTVFHDVNGNGTLDASDPLAGPGYIVELVDNTGVVVATTTTLPNSTYTMNVTPGSGYKIVFKDPAGSLVGGAPNLTFTPGVQSQDQNLPIDPSGIVYNSVTRVPVAGVMVTITDNANNLLPDACLIDAAQQNQVTNAAGAYRFDIIPGANAACPVGETEYRLRLVNPVGYSPGFSTTLPPQAGSLEATACSIDAIPGGACQVSPSAAPPAAPAAGVYFTTLLLQLGDGNVVNNHIPIDPIISSTSGFSKRALVTEVRRGERVPYVIEANSVSFNPARIEDIMPPGFDFVAGSATSNGVDVVPAVIGRTLTFNGLVPDGTNKIKLELILVTTAAVALGPQVNNAKLINSATGALAGTAKATVTVIAEHVFDCGDIIGKVFDDKNRNGYQDQGEPGLAGVRLVTVKGQLITTDKNGLFHVACADIPNRDIGSNFILKLDTRTLPTGYRVTTDNPAIVRLTRGKVVKMNFGASVTRLVNFDMTNDAFVSGSTELKLKWLAAIDQLIGVLEQEKSTLRLTYLAKSSGSKLAGERVAAVEKLIADKWAAQADRYKLPIETRVIGSK